MEALPGGGSKERPQETRQGASHTLNPWSLTNPLPPLITTPALLLIPIILTPILIFAPLILVYRSKSCISSTSWVLAAASFSLKERTFTTSCRALSGRSIVREAIRRWSPPTSITRSYGSLQGTGNTMKCVSYLFCWWPLLMWSLPIDRKICSNLISRKRPLPWSQWTALAICKLATAPLHTSHTHHTVSCSTTAPLHTSHTPHTVSCSTTAPLHTSHTPHTVSCSTTAPAPGESSH